MTSTARIQVKCRIQSNLCQVFFVVITGCCIRDLKVKAKATVEGDKLRVSSASRDVLQSVIAALKGNDYGQPLQFVNYR